MLRERSSLFAKWPFFSFSFLLPSLFVFWLLFFFLCFENENIKCLISKGMKNHVYNWGGGLMHIFYKNHLGQQTLPRFWLYAKLRFEYNVLRVEIKFDWYTSVPVGVKGLIFFKVYCKSRYYFHLIFIYQILLQMNGFLPYLLLKIFLKCFAHVHLLFTWQLFTEAKDLQLLVISSLCEYRSTKMYILYLIKQNKKKFIHNFIFFLSFFY